MPRVRARGFTLIELMVTLAVAAVVLSMAVPSFQSVVNGNKLAGAANELIASLQVARMEAVRLGVRAGMCTSTNTNTGTDGLDATCSTANIDGWIAFVDANGDGDFDKAGDTLLRSSLLPEAMAVATSPSVGSNIIFRPDGLARAADTGVGNNLLDGVISVCIATRRPTNNQRHVEIGSGSRVSVFEVNGGGACGAPDNP